MEPIEIIPSSLSSDTSVNFLADSPSVPSDIQLPSTTVILPKHSSNRISKMPKVVSVFGSKDTDTIRSDNIGLSTSTELVTVSEKPAVVVVTSKPRQLTIPLSRSSATPLVSRSSPQIASTSSTSTVLPSATSLKFRPILVNGEHGYFIPNSLVSYTIFLEGL